MGATPRRQATEADFWAIPEAVRHHELVGGELLEKAAPSGEHGGAQFGIAASISAFQRPAAKGGPGGWWFGSEIEVRLKTGEIVRPDVLGWRRERCPQRPTGTPVEVTPDWICEIISQSNASDDTVKKRRAYHPNAIPHDWLLDPGPGTRTVLRRSADGYITVLSAERGETVRAEPFDAIELPAAALFGGDPIAVADADLMNICFRLS
ncbi:MAG TPA: Uma2 family endonuclease [Kofleriaceae bacterium]|nr:Uma2 family endonuclease [Kofleriaceae bacterium]